MTLVSIPGMIRFRNINICGINAEGSIQFICYTEEITQGLADGDCRKPGKQLYHENGK